MEGRGYVLFVIHPIFEVKRVVGQGLERSNNWSRRRGQLVMEASRESVKWCRLTKRNFIVVVDLKPPLSFRRAISINIPTVSASTPVSLGTVA